MSKKVKEAVQVIVAALKNDSDYRRAWRDNISICMQDEFESWCRVKGPRDRASDYIQQISNEGADRFLDMLCSQS